MVSRILQCAPTGVVARSGYVSRRRHRSDASSTQPRHAGLWMRPDEKLRHWKDLLTMRWERIDLPRARHLCSEMKQSLRALEQAGGDLAQAKERWEAAKARAANVQQQLKQKGELLGGDTQWTLSGRKRMKNSRSARRAGRHGRIGSRAATAPNWGLAGRAAGAIWLRLESEQRSNIEHDAERGKQRVQKREPQGDRA